MKPSQSNKEGAKERSCLASEVAEQREQRLSRRRIRDRARREAQSVEQRQILLQRRRERLNAESGEQRDVRLQQMRELTEETEELPSHLSKEQPDYSR